MLWEPAVSAEVEKVATPLLSAALPICVVPSRKFTVPVGLPAVPGATVAVKVTAWFRLADVGARLNVVIVVAFCTT